MNPLKDKVIDLICLSSTFGSDVIKLVKDFELLVEENKDLKIRLESFSENYNEIIKENKFIHKKLDESKSFPEKKEIIEWVQKTPLYRDSDLDGKIILTASSVYDKIKDWNKEESKNDT